MKTVKLGTILENAARLAGRQVAQMGVPDKGLRIYLIDYVAIYFGHFC